MRGKNRVKPRKKSRTPLQGEKPNGESLVANDPIWPPSIPRLLCSNFSTIRFADTVEPSLIADALLFSSMFSKAMFLVDQCIIPETAGMADAWFTPMLFDAAYLNAVCFTIQTYLDGYFARRRSAEAQRRDCVYYAKTIRILQERLELDALSGHAYTAGNYESANHHINGLLKLVSMRGVGTFTHNTKLLIEIIRCDLGMAIDRGSRPLLFASNSIPWTLMLTSDIMTVPGEKYSWRQIRGDLGHIQNRLDPELATVWAAMSEFCALMNEAAENTRFKISEEAFLHSMGSIMYRLLYQRFEMGSLNETVRLGLLAFSSPIFLHWNRVELPDPQFTSAYREALAALGRMESNVEPRERLWLLMIGALSMYHEPDRVAWFRPWLRMDINLCGVFNWSDMRDLLGSFLWVGLVFDALGKELFESVLLQ
ncbi:hypothetical protein N7510_009365 [Penicillium lagena]|uniref:uncharacterized protein n=1 Tax=Penicillium lagena TaxID=94218 RepID=UPI002540E7CE|nr:uncharacterized protein N7510_009365 [Penicillium lagena]KAJ5606584.1 hypothetical protein N7510_009365 [Penicillium lagena]